MSDDEHKYSVSNTFKELSDLLFIVYKDIEEVNCDATTVWLNTNQSLSYSRETKKWNLVDTKVE